MNFLISVLIRILLELTRTSKRYLNGFNTVMIDFDGVLFPTNGKLFDNDFENNEPPDAIVRYIDWLYSHSFRVAVFTSRAVFNPSSYFKIHKYLKKWGIKFDYITPVKFPAIVYIDDSAIFFDTERCDCYKVSATEASEHLIHETRRNWLDRIERRNYQFRDHKETF
jgi:hypothetical protein